MLVSGFAVLALAACGGGSNGDTASAGSGGTGGAGTVATAVDTAQFCKDIKNAGTAIEDTFGDNTDPEWAEGTTLLGKAKAEAPASIEPVVSKMYDFAKAALKNAGNGKTYSTDDFNKNIDTLNDWTKTNCTSTGGLTVPKPSDNQ